MLGLSLRVFRSRFFLALPVSSNPSALLLLNSKGDDFEPFLALFFSIGYEAEKGLRGRRKGDDFKGQERRRSRRLLFNIISLKKKLSKFFSVPQIGFRRPSQ